MNAREGATLFLLTVGLLLTVAHPGTRSSAWAVLRSLAKPKLFVPIASLGAWIGLAIVAASRLHLWAESLTFATVAWYFTNALAWLVSPDNSRKADFFTSKLRQLITAGVLLEMYLNLYVFRWWIEVPLQALLAALVILKTVADHEDQYRPARTLFGGILNVIGLGILFTVTYRVVREWRSLDAWDLFQQLAHPVWLTVWTLPYVYAFALVASYEVLWNRLRWSHDPAQPQPMAWLGVMSITGPLRRQLRELLEGPWRELHSAHSFTQGRTAARHELATRRAAEEARLQRRLALERNAGRIGTDPLGRQLDRREFEETKSELRWLSTCQMGWHRQLGHYRADLLEFALSASRSGLPEHHGIQLSVADDGQAWFAARECPSGYSFAIGATQPDALPWYYDGPTAPSGLPAREHGWKSELEPLPPEWLSETGVGSRG